MLSVLEKTLRIKQSDFRLRRPFDGDLQRHRSLSDSMEMSLPIVPPSPTETISSILPIQPDGFLPGVVKNKHASSNRNILQSLRKSLWPPESRQDEIRLCVRG
jgi:hypothetical protein